MSRVESSTSVLQRYGNVAEARQSYTVVRCVVCRSSTSLQAHLGGTGLTPPARSQKRKVKCNRVRVSLMKIVKGERPAGFPKQVLRAILGLSPCRDLSETLLIFHPSLAGVSLCPMYQKWP